MNPLKLTPPQWRVLRYLGAHSATAARVGFRAGELRARTGAGSEELTGLAGLGLIAGRLHGSEDSPRPQAVRAAADNAKLRIHLMPSGKSAAEVVEAAYRALRHLRTHGPALPLDTLQDDAGTGPDTLTELEACGHVEIAPMCPECHEPAQHDPPASWTPAWGRAPAWSHLDGEPLCPVVGANGYEPATPASTDRLITITSFGRRYAEPYSRQDQS